MKRAVRTVLALAVAASSSLAGCGGSDPMPRVLAVTPASFEEGTMMTIAVTVDGLAPLPGFDLDRAMGTAEGSGRVILNPGGRVLATTREAYNRFQALVPPILPPGRYDLVVQTDDGREARQAGALRVSGATMNIETVQTDREYVGAQLGDVPLWVVIRNRSVCPLTNLSVVPRFEREGVDRAGTEFVARIGTAVRDIPPLTTRTIPFTVSMLPGVRDGAVALDAYATAERSESLGCMGSVSAPFAERPGRWSIVTQHSTDLEVSQLRLYPQQPGTVSRSVNMTFRLRNLSSERVHIDLMRLESTPDIIESTMPPDINPRDLPPGEDAAYQMSATLVPNLRAQTDARIRVNALAHDDRGGVHTTHPTEGTAIVTVRAE